MSIPPCRVLLQNGKPVYVLVEKRSISEIPTFKRTEVGRIYDTPFIIPANRIKGRAPVSTHNKARSSRASGSGRAWNLMTDMTDEKIEEMRSRNVKVREIAQEFGCSSSAVFKRLRLMRRRDSAKLVKEESEKICPTPGCSRRKLIRCPVCCVCKRKGISGAVPEA